MRFYPGCSVVFSNVRSNHVHSTFWQSTCSFHVHPRYYRSISVNVTHVTLDVIQVFIDFYSQLYVDVIQAFVDVIKLSVDFYTCPWIFTDVRGCYLCIRGC